MTQVVVLASDIARAVSILKSINGTFGYGNYVSLFGSTRLRSVEINFAQSVLTLTSASVEWLTHAATSGVEVSQSSVSPAVPLRIVTSPPALYPAALPQASDSSTPLFRISALAGAVIDVVAECTIQDGPSSANWSGHTDTEPPSTLEVAMTCGGSLDQNASYVAGVLSRTKPLGLFPAYNTYHS